MKFNAEYTGNSRCGKSSYIDVEINHRIYQWPVSRNECLNGTFRKGDLVPIIYNPKLDDVVAFDISIGYKVAKSFAVFLSVTLTLMLLYFLFSRQIKSYLNLTLMDRKKGK